VRVCGAKPQPQGALSVLDPVERLAGDPVVAASLQACMWSGAGGSGGSGLSAVVIARTARTRPFAGWSAGGGADFSPDGQCGTGTG
jgi:hypothetical protein